MVNSYIKRQTGKGLPAHIYDYKLPDLSTIAYNHLLKHTDKCDRLPQFYITNSDGPHRSHHCDPIVPEFMSNISDAHGSIYTIMLNLNCAWIQKQRDFFVESPVVLLVAIIWCLKICENGLYCSSLHTIEFLNRPYPNILEILMGYDELVNYSALSMDAWKGGA